MRWLGLIENYAGVQGIDKTGRAVTIIPDSLTRGFLEFKNVLNVTDARGQISAMADAARTAGQPLNLFISDRTVSVSSPVIRAVTQTGGNIWRLDPGSGTIQWFAGASMYGALP